MAQRQGRVAKTEVAGRPPLPRHEGLPAGKKGGWKKWRGRDGEDSLWKKRRRADVKEGEAEWGRWHKYGLWLHGVFRAGLGRGQPVRPPAAFTQPHLSQCILIGTIWLKDEPAAINASSEDSSTVSPALTPSSISIRGLAAKRSPSPDLHRSQQKIKCLFQTPCKWTGWIKQH